MRKIITTTFLLLLVSSIAVQAQRKDQSERRPEMKERFEKKMGPNAQMQRGPDAMLRKLDLNEDQKEQVKEIMLAGKKESIPLENQIGEKRARLRTLSTGENYDVKALNNVVDEMSELQAEIKKIHIAKKGEIRALLNEGQKVIFDSMPDKGKRLKRKVARHRR